MKIKKNPEKDVHLCTQLLLHESLHLSSMEQRPMVLVNVEKIKV